MDSDDNLCFFCLKPAKEVCLQCQLVRFCSEEHFNIHRPETYCFPFKVKQSDNVGRYIVATRDIKPSEMILYDSPVVLGPKTVVGELECLQCLKKITGEVGCEKCTWPVCDMKCQNGRTHTKECDILARARLRFSDIEGLEKKLEAYRGITPLRLLMLRDTKPEVYTRLNFLMDHNDERKLDKVSWESQKKFFRDFASNHDLTQLSGDDFDRVTGLLWTNAFECCKGGGQALYPTLSLLSHSCLPNAAHVVFANNHLVLHAKDDIKAGEEICISYISIYQGKLRRRIKLRDKWFFTCLCSRCVDPSENGSHYSTFICQQEGDEKCGGNVVQINFHDLSADFVCQRCSKVLSFQDALRIENSMMEVLQGCAKTKSVKELKSALAVLDGQLHANHYLIILAKRQLISLLGQNLDLSSTHTLQERIKLCQQVLDVFNRIDKGLSYDKGAILYQSAESLKLLSKNLFSLQKISQQEFSKMVQEALDQFEEYQKCSILSFKREL